MSGGDRTPVIIGVGETDWVGKADPAAGRIARSSLGLHAEAAWAAVADAGLRMSDVDGLYTNDSYLDYHVRHAMAVAEYIGMPATAKLISTIQLGSGASSGLFVHYAAEAVRSGRCDTVLCVSADNFLSGLARSGAMQALSANRDKEFEAPYGPTLPACFALVAQRYLHEYDLGPEIFAEVAVSMRAHAVRNPRAQMQGPLTREAVLASKPVASPFTMLMCSLVSDGGAAVLVTTRERAADLGRPAVEIMGCGMNYAGDGERVHNSLSITGDLLDIGTKHSARAAMAQAGVSHDDIDLVMTYDCFAIMPILFLEAAGFCEPGTGASLFASGATGPGGRLPVNTHGGMMSYAHPGNPGGLFMFPELVRQLRGGLGDRQVEGARTGLVTGYGGQMAFWPSTVLGVRS